MVELSELKTCDLVRELSRREGVEAHEIGPSVSLNVKADGPCVVLVVVD